MDRKPPPQLPPEQDLDLMISHWRLQRLALRDELAELLASTMLDPALGQCHERLTGFCNDLVDYVCSGHFLIYRRLLQQHAACSCDWTELRNEIYRHICSSTDQVLAFNEKFEAASASQSPLSIARDLGRLARGMLVRFALEEQLLVCAKQAA